MYVVKIKTVDVKDWITIYADSQLEDTLHLVSHLLSKKDLAFVDKVMIEVTEVE